MAEASDQRAVRGGRAAPGLVAHGADAPRPAAEGRHRPARRPRCIRAEGRPERRRDPGFAMRGGRVVERMELAPTRRRRSATRTCLQAALQQFYEMRVPPAEIDLPLDIEDREAMEGWLSERAARRVKFWCRNAATSVRWWSSRHATRTSRTGRGSTRTQPRISMRSKRYAPSWSCRRCRAGSMFRHLDDPGQRDGRVDGRLRRRADEEGGIPKFRIRGIRFPRP